MRLLCNAAAYFDLCERFGDKSLFDAIGQNDIEGFENLCFAAAVMSEQAEARRRIMGLEYEKPKDELYLKMNLMPNGVLTLKMKVLDAIRRGLELHEEADGTEEVDVVLAEINKKKTRGRSEKANT